MSSMEVGVRSHAPRLLLLPSPSFSDPATTPALQDSGDGAVGVAGGGSRPIEERASEGGCRLGFRIWIPE
jgi:hypothetical protein